MTTSRSMKATEFKAKCLAVLDDVNRRGETIVITKRGKPVAYVSRVKPEPKRASMFGRMKGTFAIVGDIVSPTEPARVRHAEQGRLV